MADESAISQVPTETTSNLEKRIERLQTIFPEAFSENKVDFEKLRATLGDFVDTEPERYRFTWAGRTPSIRIRDKPSKGTLVPSRGESIDFDDTKNIFIEGENLEVLKILQKGIRRACQDDIHRSAIQYWK